MSLFCDVRIGELSRGLPTKQGKRTDVTSPIAVNEVTKRQSEQNAGISHKQAIDLQRMAAHVDVVERVIQEAEETAQTFAKVGIYADQRIGEILRELPTRQGARTDVTSVVIPTKVEAEKQANIDHHTAIDAEGESRETKK